MNAAIKCVSCEEPIELTDTYCPVCDTKQNRPESIRSVTVAAGLALPGVIYCIAVGRYLESIALAIAPGFGNPWLDAQKRSYAQARDGRSSASVQQLRILQTKFGNRRQVGSRRG